MTQSASASGRPQISAVIKCLNEERNIGRCLRAAMARLAAYDAEIILADCLSSDRTIEIARQFPVRIVQLTDPATRRCGAAAQLGWQYANGQMILLMDADMELCPGFLEAAVAALQDDPGLAGVGGRLIEMSSAMEFRERMLRASPDERPGVVRRISGCVLYRRSAISQDGYLMDRNLHNMEEFEAGLRLRRRGWRLQVLPVAAVRHHGHPDPALALLAKRWRTRFFDGYGEMLRAHLGRTSEPGALLEGIAACRFQLLTIAWWLALAALALAAATRPPWFAIGLACLLPAPALLLLHRKRDVARAMHAWCVWQVSAAALIRGLLAPRTPPTRPLPARVLQEAPAPRHPPYEQMARAK